MREFQGKIEKEANKRGLTTNQQKFKYMQIDKEEPTNKNREVQIGPQRFEKIYYFKYFGTKLNCKNETNIEFKQDIDKLIMVRKRINIDTKMKIYKSSIKPVVKYDAEVVVITRKEEERLTIFERKIMKK